MWPVHRFARMRYACDIDRWLTSDAGETVDWDEFGRLAIASGYGPGVWLALRIQAQLREGTVPPEILASLEPGSLRRGALRRLAGAELLSILADGPSRAGPSGVALTLCCASGVANQARHVRGWIFPSKEDMHLAYGKQKHRSLARLYLDRLISKTSGSAEQADPRAS